MSGMYPHDRVLEIFGENVKWPGLGPDGKFSNGSFSDPHVKPSFIPAETLNLLVDNMQSVIAAAGLTPNNIEQDQLLRAFHSLELSIPAPDITKPIGLVVSSLPDKIAYEVGEAFDPSGLVVRAIYAGMAMQNIYPATPNVEGTTGDVLSTPNMDSTGQKPVTVTFLGVTTSLVIHVTEGFTPPVITGIELTALPTKTVYEKGEPLDLSGIVVRAVYSTGVKTQLLYDSSGVMGYKSSLPDMSAIGHKTITISYTPDGTTFFQTFGIDISIPLYWNGVVDNDTETSQNLLTVFNVSTVEEVWEITHQRINADGLSNYYGLGLGDYMDIVAGLPAPLNIAWNANHINLRIYILGFNIYKGSQGNTKNHILWGFRHIPLQRRMNAANTNTGGYPASELKSFIDDNFLTSLAAALGKNYFYNVSRLVSTKGGSTVMQAKLWLANEMEIFGKKTYGDDPEPQVAIPLYAKKDATFYIKNFNGGAPHWWVGSPSGNETGRVCIVHSNGFAALNNANDAIGVSPCFCKI